MSQYPSPTVTHPAGPDHGAQSATALCAEADTRPIRTLPIGLEIGMGALLRFKSMMALDGQTVQVARMCYDRDYAYERIACAHGSASDPLRRLALELFQTFHRRSEASSFAA